MFQLLYFDSLFAEVGVVETVYWFNVDLGFSQEL
ncbi:MAG: hypothetical protein ACI9Y1_000128 [Lentisphaeria bacterium]|jgi:hypothetical protein